MKLGKRLNTKEILDKNSFKIDNTFLRTIRFYTKKNLYHAEFLVDTRVGRLKSENILRYENR